MADATRADTSALRIIDRTVTVPATDSAVLCDENFDRIVLMAVSSLGGQGMLARLTRATNVATDQGFQVDTALTNSNGFILTYRDFGPLVGRQWFVHNPNAAINTIYVVELISDLPPGAYSSDFIPTPRAQPAARNGRNNGFAVARPEPSPQRRGDLGATYQQILDILRRNRCSRRRNNRLSDTNRANPYL